MARTAFVVNDALREKVRHLAGLGVRQDDIARMIGCAPKTLRKRLRDELDRGVAEGLRSKSQRLTFASPPISHWHRAALKKERVRSLQPEHIGRRPISATRLPAARSPGTCANSERTPAARLP
jgi:hypothetical protein